MRWLLGLRSRRAAQVAALLIVCAVGAELLAAYGDTTGDVGGIAFALVFFGALYGAPALLARELVRRRGWGWPSLLLVLAALGVVQACLIDQSLFSRDYQGYEGWQETREATFVPWLGVAAFNAYNFVGGHVIFSFAAPVALAEAWRPGIAHRPWLSRTGMAIAVVAYLGAAALIVTDPESRTATRGQLALSVLLVVLLLAAAVRVGRRGSGGAAREDLPATSPSWRFWIVVLTCALVVAGAPATWTGLVLGLGATTMLAAGLWWTSRHLRWSIRHQAAVGLAFLLARGVLAFTYFPVLGEVGPAPKYAHNVVMLTIVLLAGWAALRSPHCEAAGTFSSAPRPGPMLQSGPRGGNPRRTDADGAEVESSEPTR